MGQCLVTSLTRAHTSQPASIHSHSPCPVLQLTPRHLGQRRDSLWLLLLALGFLKLKAFYKPWIIVDRDSQPGVPWGEVSKIMTHNIFHLVQPTFIEGLRCTQALFSLLSGTLLHSNCSRSPISEMRKLRPCPDFPRVAIISFITHLVA